MEYNSEDVGNISNGEVQELNNVSINNYEFNYVKTSGRLTLLLI